MRQEREGSDSLGEIFELEENYRETTLEELKSYESRLRRMKETGCDLEDFILDGMIDLTKQAIRIKQEENPESLRGN